MLEREKHSQIFLKITQFQWNETNKGNLNFMVKFKKKIKKMLIHKVAKIRKKLKF
jgi:hypothetical protein